MNNMNLGRQLLSNMATQDHLVDRGDASGCAMEGQTLGQYVDLLPKLTDQERKQLLAEAKKNHPILFEDISGHCTKSAGGPWRIERD